MAAALKVNSGAWAADPLAGKDTWQSYERTRRIAEEWRQWMSDEEQLRALKRME